MFDYSFGLFGSVALGSSLLFGFIFFVAVIAILFRVVVDTNHVHIVQSGRKTISYGKDMHDGNVYYSWPAWIPLIGVKTIELPVSVFVVELESYAGYDKGRVPFEVDIMAFFRIDDPNTAAQRVSSIDELKGQLQGILQGACRSILAKSEIEEILEDRATFGVMFTDAVDEQLKAWGVTSVKAIELMDIRDVDKSSVIANIMAKKKSHIEMESRIAVANNRQLAENAEIEAARQVALTKQQAEEVVGQRTAAKEQAVGIAHEQAQQAIREQAATTAAKEVEVLRVKEVGAADIQKATQIVHAEQERQTKVINADAEKQRMVIAAEARRQETVIAADAARQQTVVTAEAHKEQSILTASGDLEIALKSAEGIKAEGLAQAEADKAKQLASVTAQTTLAEKIGENEGYQDYLIRLEKVKADQIVGVAQAKSLEKADINLIATNENVSACFDGAAKLLTASGGTSLGAALEALGNTEQGKALLTKLTGTKSA